MIRKESRGVNYTIDYPERGDKKRKRDTVIGVEIDPLTYKSALAKQKYHAMFI